MELIQLPQNIDTSESALAQISSDLRKIVYFLLKGKIDEFLAASEIRRKTLDLCDGSLTVGEMAEKLDKAQPNVSAAISELVDAGLVRVSRREGRSNYYVKAS